MYIIVNLQCTEIYRSVGMNADLRENSVQSVVFSSQKVLNEISTRLSCFTLVHKLFLHISLQKSGRNTEDKYDVIFWLGCWVGRWGVCHTLLNVVKLIRISPIFHLKQRISLVRHIFLPLSSRSIWLSKVSRLCSSLHEWSYEWMSWKTWSSF